MASSPVPKDSPVMIAWEAYKSEADYANTRRWALHEERVDGSLWAAFNAGHFAAHSVIAGKVAELTDPRAIDFARQFAEINASDLNGLTYAEYGTIAAKIRRMSAALAPYPERR